MAELDTPKRQNKELPKGGVKPNINKPNIINLISNQSIYPQAETKKDEKIDGKKKQKKEMSYSEVLKSIGSMWWSNPRIVNEQSLSMYDDDRRDTSSCRIPYSFIENPTALKSGLQYIISYSYLYSADNPYSGDERPIEKRKMSQRFASRTLDVLTEIITSGDFKCQGKTVNPEIVIDKINEINQDCCLSSWLYEFEEEWTNIMKSYDIKNQNAYFKTCVWSSLRDYLSKSDNLSMYYSNLLLAR